MKIKLVVGSFSDWFTIERVEHDNKTELRSITEEGFSYSYLYTSARITGGGKTCVEGTGQEMRAICAAIKDKSEAVFKRCAVDATGDSVKLWSPRNTQEGDEGEVSYTEALEFAVQAMELMSFEEEAGWEAPRSYGDLMPIQEFIEDCQSHCLIDYDGSGVYASATMDTKKRVYPSDVTGGVVDTRFTHVRWFNK